ncbi:hypothetical protein GBA52_010579 [Prunus armeniaca]|nr:hypothetical protein GBA52_010579 [Prunus armeniaca]
MAMRLIHESKRKWKMREGGETMTLLPPPIYSVLFDTRRNDFVKHYKMSAKGGHSNWRTGNRAEPHRTKPEKNRIDQKVNNRSKTEPDRFGSILDPVPCLQKPNWAEPNRSN